MACAATGGGAGGVGSWGRSTGRGAGVGGAGVGRRDAPARRGRGRPDPSLRGCDLGARRPSWHSATRFRGRRPQPPATRLHYPVEEAHRVAHVVWQRRPPSSSRGAVRQTRRARWHHRCRSEPRGSAERRGTERGAGHGARPRSTRAGKDAALAFRQFQEDFAPAPASPPLLLLDIETALGRLERTLPCAARQPRPGQRSIGQRSTPGRGGRLRQG